MRLAWSTRLRTLQDPCTTRRSPYFLWPQVESGFTWCSVSSGSPKALVRLTLFIDYDLLTRRRLWVMESSRAKSRNNYVGHSLANRKLTDGSRQSSELAPRCIGAMRPPGPSARKRRYILDILLLLPWRIECPSRPFAL
jgi:hypothetical protein